MSEIAKSAEGKPSQFWIYKGTSNHCSQLEYDYKTDTYEKSTPDGFYDYVCTKDTVQGGIHVLEAAPVLEMLESLAEALDHACVRKLGCKACEARSAYTAFKAGLGRP